MQSLSVNEIALVSGGARAQLGEAVSKQVSMQIESANAAHPWQPKLSYDLWSGSVPSAEALKAKWKNLKLLEP